MYSVRRVPLALPAGPAVCGEYHLRLVWPLAGYGSWRQPLPTWHRPALAPQRTNLLARVAAGRSHVPDLSTGPALSQALDREAARPGHPVGPDQQLLLQE